MGDAAYHGVSFGEAMGGEFWVDVAGVWAGIQVVDGIPPAHDPAHGGKNGPHYRNLICFHESRTSIFILLIKGFTLIRRVING